MKAEPLLPAVRPTVDRDYVLVIFPRGAFAHPAIDEPLSQACHAADHGNFVERDLWIISEVLAEPADPRFHRETRIIGEAQSEQGDVAGSRIRQDGARPVRNSPFKRGIAEATRSTGSMTVRCGLHHRCWRDFRTDSGTRSTPAPGHNQTVRHRP